MSVQEHYQQVGTQRWFYREGEPHGDVRMPAVLLHGIPGHSYTWRGVVPALNAAGIRAIMPDWLGCGRSDKPDRAQFAYTPDAYVDALDAFLAGLQLETFAVVVQGFLATAGIQYALRHSKRIERLVIVNTPLGTQTKLPSPIAQWGLPLIGDMLTQDPLQGDRVLEKGSGFVIAEEDLTFYRQPFLKSSQAGRSLKTLVANLRLKATLQEIESGLKGWTGQTLIVWGEADPWLDITAAEQLAQKPNFELVRLPEAKHFPQEHWSKEMAPLIVDFLRRQPM